MMGQAVAAGRRVMVTPEVQEVSTVGLLQWAFSAERAALNFDEFDREGGGGVGMEYILMQRHILGCKVDGGGWSAPADDADLVADIVAHLPVECGGRGMAIQIAEYARSGRQPDWMPGAKPRVEPREWHVNRHGRHAKTESVGMCEVRTRRGVRRVDVRWCPVTITPTVAQIMDARRAYLGWWGALLHLRGEFQRRTWRRHLVTDALPPMAPWRADEKGA